MLNVVRGGVAAIALVAGLVGSAPAQAYWPGGYYGYGPRAYAYPWAPPVYYRPYFRPFYRSPVVVMPPPAPVYFAPPPVYVAPPRPVAVRPVYAAPRRVVSRAAPRVRSVQPPCNCPASPSPFAGAGVVPSTVPVSVPGPVPPLAPAPRAVPSVAPAVPAPAVPSGPPPLNAYPPERPFTPFTGD